ncbi:MAG: hypothetical protein ACT4O1_01845 [Gemmatimonadota bacterium]
MSATRISLLILLSAANTQCGFLGQVGQNLPPAETPTLYAPVNVNWPAIAPVQMASSVSADGEAFEVIGLQPAGSCANGIAIPADRRVVVNIMKRSLTDIQLHANGVLMRQPTSHDQERWWTEDGTGFYYLDKVSLVSAGEVNDMYDDERLLIMLPTAIAAVRPMTLEIRGVSNNSNYTGTQRISDPLLVTLALCPDFTVRANTVPNLPQGGREVFDVIVARNAAMGDAVTVSVDIPPAGVTFAFAPQPVAGGTTTTVATMPYLWQPIT